MSESPPEDQIVDHPSAEYISRVNQVEVDRGTHTRKDSIQFYHGGSSRRIQPGDDTHNGNYHQLSAEKIRGADADPQSCFVARIKEDANVPLPPGSYGLFEAQSDHTVRFVGDVETFKPE